MKEWSSLSHIEKRAVEDIWQNGPDCAKFLSRRIKEGLKETMELLANLEQSGWLERVQGTFLFKRGMRRPKHMNHTYYQLTKRAKKELRFLARKGIL